MNSARVAWLSLAVGVLPAGAVAQRLAPIPQSVLSNVRWPAAATAAAPRDRSSDTIPRTYWLEGGLIGGVGLGVFTALAVRGLCESSNCTRGEIAAGVLGGAVGFTAGSLLGGQFRKKAKN